MKSVLAASGAVSLALVSALVLAGCQSPPPPPPLAPAPPPPPPAPPPLALSGTVVKAAAAYQAYVRQATALTPNFADGQAIQTELQQGESYEAKAFARDTVAYAAVVALQEPTFVQGVRVFAVDPNQRAEMVRKIEEDPNYAASFPGAQAAANLIAAKLAADGEAISRAGYAIKQSAYTIQHQKWSTEWIKDPSARLELAKQISSTAGVAPIEESDALMRTAMTGQGMPATPPTQTPLTPPYTTGVNRGLAIAALAALGAAGDDAAGQIEPLMDENVGQPCLKLAKLNLFQCLAVSKPHYEDVFCLGQHALMDTGECVSREAGVLPVNFEPPLPPKPAEEPKVASKKGKHHAAPSRHRRRHT